MPIDYVLEVRYRGQTRLAMTFPWHPQSFVRKTPSHTSVTHLMDGSVIREHGRVRVQEFQASGNSGLETRSGYDRYGKVILARGPEIFREFEKFLEDYHTLNEAEPEAWDMVVRAFSEDIHWLVEPESFEWKRDARTSRFTYDWFLVLKGYRKFERRVPTNIFSPVSDNFQAVAQRIRDVGNYIAIADNVLTNVRTDLDSFREPVRAILTLVDGIDNVIASATSILQFPVDAISDLVTLSERLQGSYRTLVESPDILINGLPAVTERLLESLQISFDDAESSARIAAGRSGANRGTVLRSSQRLTASQVPQVPQPATTAPNAGASTYEVRQDQDLEDIAQLLFGEEGRGRWLEIAELNGLVTNRTYADGTPLLPGDVLQVPAVAGAGGGSPFVPISQRQDLAVGPDGDLVVGAGALLSPRDSVLQSVRHRLQTVRGTIVWRNFGLEDVRGLKMTQRAIGYVSAEVVASLQQDPRISGVKDLVVQAPASPGDLISLSGTIVLTGADSVAWRIP